MLTADFLTLMGMISHLPFRAMSDQERLGFAGASADAVVCDHSEALAELEALLIEEFGATRTKYGPLAVLSQNRLELHGVDERGESCCFTIILKLDRGY